MKKRNIFMLAVWCLAAVWSSCNDESTPEAKWEYPGPRPEIANGPGEAQKMCYALYQKYDLHVYYSLSGEEALITEVGTTQTNPIIGNNSEAIPMQAADEATAEKFLKLLTAFYELLPGDLPAQDLHKRHVLVKINPSSVSYVKEDGEEYWSNTFTEDQQGIIYYGYLDDSEDTDDKFATRLESWKWGICYEFFRGLASSYFKNPGLPNAFPLISKGLYYYENETGENICLEFSYDYYMYVFKEDVANQCGFIHPEGVMASSEEAAQDWGTYVAWILTKPLAERAADLSLYGKVKQKYDLVIEYYKQRFNLDLEEVAVKWQEVDC